jgi:putative endonuclease
MNNAETGKIGENIAYKYLLDKKYLILTRNYKRKSGEIDIIGRSPDGRLIFFEVKTLNVFGTSRDEFMPEDNLSNTKHRKMIRASEVFLAKYPKLVWENKGWQIDLIAVVLRNGKLADLRHYENL